MDEILEKLKKQLNLTGFSLNSGVNFFLTGGGAEVSNIEKNFINYLGPNVKKLGRNTLEEDNVLKKNFSSCLGALKIIKDGWETEAIPKRSNKNIEKVGFFAKIFNINN